MAGRSSKIDIKKLAQRLTKLMDEQGLSAYELNARIMARTGIDTYKAIVALMKGTGRVPQKRTLERIALELSVSSAFLERGELEVGEKRKIFPNVLPPEPDLIGREKDLTDLKQRVLSGSNKLTKFALHGIPGIGKSALALKLVYDEDVRGYFDGIFWAGFGKNGDPLAHLGIWAERLGVPSEKLKELSSVEQRAKEIRAIIADRRMLFVVDDVWQLESSFAFLVGGPQCVHVITTRRPDLAVSFADDGGILLVDELTEKEGVELLKVYARSVVESDLEKAQELVRVVGGLPLALMVIGRFLKKEGYTRLPDRIQQSFRRLLENKENRLHLGEPQRPIEQHPSLPASVHISLDEVVQLSDSVLTEEGSQAFRALSVFPSKPNTFSQDAACAVTASSIDILYELVDAGLLEVDEQSRFFLHQTISDYASVKRIDDGPWERITTFYDAYMIHPQGDYRAFENEWLNIEAAIGCAIKSQALKPAQRIILSAFEFMEAIGLQDNAYNLTSFVVDTIREAKRLELLPLLLRNLGRIERTRGNNDQAREFFSEGFALAKNSDDKKVMAILGMSVGTSWFDVAQWDKSKHYYEQALTLAEELDMQDLRCHLLRNLSAIETVNGTADGVETYLQQALQIAHDLDNQDVVIIVLQSLSENAIREGRYSQAKNYVETVVQAARKIGHKQCLPGAFTTLGVIEFHQTNYEESKVHYTEAMELAEELGDIQTMALLHLNFGTVNIRCEEFDEAKDFLEKGVALAQKIKFYRIEGALLSSLGTVEMHYHNYDLADKYFQDALSLADRLDFQEIKCGALLEQGKLLQTLNNWNNAKKNYSESLRIGKLVGHKEFTGRSLYGLAQIARDQNYIDEARQKGQESLAIFEEIGHGEAVEVRDWLKSLTDIPVLSKKGMSS